MVRIIRSTVLALGLQAVVAADNYPSPTPSPTYTYKPTSSPTAIPTPHPTTYTYRPTSSPTPYATPDPTYSPTPYATPDPTYSPTYIYKPTSSPTPYATPHPTYSPTPYPTVYPTYSPTPTPTECSCRSSPYHESLCTEDLPVLKDSKCCLRCVPPPTVAPTPVPTSPPAPPYGYGAGYGTPSPPVPPYTTLPTPEPTEPSVCPKVHAPNPDSYSHDICQYVCDRSCCCEAEATCFPGDSEVLAKDGAIKLNEVEAGTMVSVGSEFEPVFCMLHSPSDTHGVAAPYSGGILKSN